MKCQFRCTVSTKICPFKALVKEPEIQGWIERLFARNTLCIKTKNESLSQWQDVKSWKAKGCIRNKLKHHIQISKHLYVMHLYTQHVDLNT
jgi:hypothetical protein